ncbi:hypothetical protein ACFLX2_00280 [Candidatus Dependentiae bacterium]
MNKQKIVFIIAALIALTIASYKAFYLFKTRKSEETLEYTIAPKIDTAKPFFKVHLTFCSSQMEKLRFILPLSFHGQTQLYGQISDLQILANKKTVFQKKKITQDMLENNHLLVPIDSNKKQMVSVKYRFVPRAIWHKGIPKIDSRYFRFIGRTLFIFPDTDLTKKINVKLRWKNIPASWNVINSHGVNQTTQRIEIPARQFITKECMYAGGDFEIHKKLIQGKPLYIGIRGSWRSPQNDLTKKDFIDLTEKIVHEERSFWNDFNYPYFFVLLIPSESETSFWGTGLYNGFCLTWKNRVFNREATAFILAHELFHNWVGSNGKIKMGQAEYYWFSEGFTDYYAALILLRIGIISFENYVKRYNNVLFNYFTSPARNYPSKKAIELRHTSWRIEKLPHYQGNIIAQEWNTNIKAKSNGKYSLDNIMLDLKNAARGADLALSFNSLLEQVSKKYLKKEVLADIKKYIIDGQTIQPTTNALGPCCSLEIKKMKEFDEGCKLGLSIQKGKIIGVKKDGPAYKAGLRDGQIILKWDTVVPPQKNSLIKLKIKDLDGSIKTVRYYPKGKREFDVPQYVVKQ